jgi:hypothetical protein
VGMIPRTGPWGDPESGPWAAKPSKAASSHIDAAKHAVTVSIQQFTPNPSGRPILPSLSDTEETYCSFRLPCPCQPSIDATRLGDPPDHSRSRGKKSYRTWRPPTGEDGNGANAPASDASSAGTGSTRSQYESDQDCARKGNS